MKLKSYLEPWLQGSLNGVLSFPASEHKEAYEDGGGSVTNWCPTLVTQWTAACQAPLSMEISRQEYWNGLPFPSAGDLPDPGIKPGSPPLEGVALTSEPPGKPLY